MKKFAYYNEIDPFAASWLRNLIAAGHIADGEVDERSIDDVRPDELSEFTQCHFFAGIGVWSFALRLAGWPDDRPVWTGSCPCQPFSQAGKGNGFDDERHLWPHWFWLIEQCKPPIIFGEQVASKDGLNWFDLVSSDLEGSDYAVGKADLCAAGIGAPHIRQRLWFTAINRMGDRIGQRLERHSRDGDGKIGRPREIGSTPAAGEPGGLANGYGHGRKKGGITKKHEGEGFTADGKIIGIGSLHGYWRDADWLFCRDGRWRPVESGTFPLAHGSSRILVCLCSFCETEIIIYENMPFLRKTNYRERQISSEILQQRMLLVAQIINTDNKQKHWALQSEIENEYQCMQEMRGERKFTSSSQRQKSIERFGEKSGNSLSKMSWDRAFRESLINMRCMWKGIQSGVTQKQEQNMFCAMCERMGPHKCKEEVGPNRIGLLRGYGNAIVAPLAKIFIETVMESNI